MNSPSENNKYKYKSKKSVLKEFIDRNSDLKIK